MNKRGDFGGWNIVWVTRAHKFAKYWFLYRNFYLGTLSSMFKVESDIKIHLAKKTFEANNPQLWYILFALLDVSYHKTNKNDDVFGKYGTYQSYLSCQNFARTKGTLAYNISEQNMVL